MDLINKPRRPMKKILADLKAELKTIGLLGLFKSQMMIFGKFWVGHEMGESEIGQKDVKYLILSQILKMAS